MLPIKRDKSTDFLTLPCIVTQSDVVSSVFHSNLGFSVSLTNHPRKDLCMSNLVQCQVSVDNFVRVRINGQMQLSPDRTAFFTVFFDFPLTLTKDLQPGGINYRVKDFPPGVVLKLALTDFCPLADTTVIRNAHEGKKVIHEALNRPQGQPEHTFHHQDGRNGKVGITPRTPTR